MPSTERYRFSGTTSTAATVAAPYAQAGGARTTAVRQSVKPSRGFGELIDDYAQTPDNWRRISEHAENATRKGARNAGASVQEIYENMQTGERIIRHTVIDDVGKVVDDHFRPNYKPRAGDLYGGN